MVFAIIVCKVLWKTKTEIFCSEPGAEGYVVIMQEHSRGLQRQKSERLITFFLLSKIEIEIFG
ncbi:hypothetical protein D3C71_1128390 [compost metagenome]